MKKVYLILTLFMTSFFLFSIKEVRVADYTYELSSSDFDVLNDRFFDIRNKTIEYINSKNLDGYIIFYNKNQDYYRVYVSQEGYTITSSTPSYNLPNLTLNLTNFKQLKLDSSNNLVFASTISDITLDIINPSNRFNNYLDSNLQILFNLSYDYQFKYNDWSYTMSKNLLIPTLYDIYLKTQSTDPTPSDKFIEEQEIINNFYSTTFTKIGDLATTVANNYTFLIILGIFILIFVFELIRSRLL